VWVRKRLDIDWRSLAFACQQAISLRTSDSAENRLQSLYGHQGLACLSVRSAWDLLLQALALPAGSEVLMSALTVPDMAAVARHHRLRVTPVDLDPVTAAPCLDSLARAYSPRSRVLLLAHLFGSHFSLSSFAEFAKERGLFLIEDCAQAYAGPTYQGDPAAVASLFSFGPIKAATALGGGVAVVRDETLLAEMHRRQREYPLQSRWFFLRRVMKYSLLKGLSFRPLYRLLFACCQLGGRDPDRMINGAARNFAGRGLLQQLRLRPSPPLLALLTRRLTGTDASNWQQKGERGQELRQLLASVIHCPGAAVRPHSYWVFPVQSSDPARLIHALRGRGFDATQGQSLATIDPPDDRPDLEPHLARTLLRQIVFLPLHAEMRPQDLQIMRATIEQVEPAAIARSATAAHLDARPVY
jgi:perosamine synthetase